MKLWLEKIKDPNVYYTVCVEEASNWVTLYHLVADVIKSRYVYFFTLDLWAYNSSLFDHFKSSENMIKSHTEDLIILDDVDFKAFSSEINFSNDKHFLILLADERLGDFEKQPASYHVTDFFEETHTSVRLGFDGMDFRFNLFLKDKHLVQAIAKKITDLAKQPNKYLEIESAMKEDRFEELELSLA